MTTWFAVNGDVLAFAASGNIRGMLGVRVHFDMVLDEGDLLRLAGGARPAVLAASDRITGYIRSDGRLYDTEAVSAAPYDMEDPGSLGVQLVANDGLGIAGDLYYRITLEDPNINGYRDFALHESYLLAPTTSTAAELADHITLPGGVPPVGEAATVPPAIHGGNAFETGDPIGGGGA